MTPQVRVFTAVASRGFQMEVNMLNRSAFLSAIALTASLVGFAMMPAYASAATSSEYSAGQFTTAALPGDAALAAGCGKWCVKVWKVCVCI